VIDLGDRIRRVAALALAVVGLRTADARMIRAGAVDVGEAPQAIRLGLVL
jgi:hypothetical protein